MEFSVKTTKAKDLADRWERGAEGYVWPAGIIGKGGTWGSAVYNDCFRKTAFH